MGRPSRGRGSPGTEPEDETPWTPAPGKFAEVYDRYFSRVYNFIRYRVRAPEAADDLAGVVFERALDKLSGFKPERGSFETWLFSIARNAVLDHLRSKARRRWLPLEEADGRPSPERPVDEAVEADESRRRLLEAVGELTPREQEILGLKFGGQMTNRTIAALLGLGESHVGVIVYRAVQKLQSKLSAAEKPRG